MAGACSCSRNVCACSTSGQVQRQRANVCLLPELRWAAGHKGWHAKPMEATRFCFRLLLAARREGHCAGGRRAGASDGLVAWDDPATAGRDAWVYGLRSALLNFLFDVRIPSTCFTSPHSACFAPLSCRHGHLRLLFRLEDLYTTAARLGGALSHIPEEIASVCHDIGRSGVFCFRIASWTAWTRPWPWAACAPLSFPPNRPRCCSWVKAMVRPRYRSYRC